MQELDKSLEEIENSTWGNPPPDATRLISTVHALRRRPIGSLDIEGLRILLGQQVGVDALTPLALTRLEDDPLAEGDFYPGDLLVAVLRLPAGHWRARPDQLARLRKVIDALPADEVDDDLSSDIAAFRAAHIDGAA